MAAMRFSAALFLLAAAGCALVDDTAPSASFDAMTGESLAHPAAPTTFVAERPGLSVIGRDYLRVSPVTVSGRGAPVTWLWCALSSSIDRDLRAARQPEVESIVLLVDDVPMSLTLEPWSEAATASPYGPPAGEERNFAARVTQSQLDRIVASAHLEAWIVEADAPSSRYALTDDSRGGWLSY
jgi:hypothetical protein